MVWMKNPLWETGKVFIIDSTFCVLEVIILMIEKGVLGSALIKKWFYWPKGVQEKEIIWHMQLKYVGDVDAVNYTICGKSYHIMAIKESNYVMLMMTTYGTLEKL